MADRSQQHDASPHVDTSPSSTPPRERPHILTRLAELLDQYVADPARILPTLNAANGSQRQQRHERRVACVQLLRAMVRYLDLVSLRVGIPQRGGAFLNFTMPFLARQAGLPLRRAERAMRDLLQAGLVKAQRRCEATEAGGFRGLAALRQLPRELFAAFGLGKWLGHERRRAVLRRYQEASRQAKAERERAWDDRAAAQISLALTGIANGLKARRPSGQPSRAGRTTTGTRSGSSELIARRVGVLKEQHPDWDRDRCYAEAYRELAIG
ncbi:hypothetical protein [Burkholderia cepacia]|uniref:hypothetical protein n=1 Tax=Burkholderia cepacia TaxID=292 RepID=UPI001FC864D4|nr:hypothetical protein [Burkholderia cepacia]